MFEPKSKKNMSTSIRVLSEMDFNCLATWQDNRRQYEVAVAIVVAVVVVVIVVKGSSSVRRGSCDVATCSGQQEQHLPMHRK